MKKIILILVFLLGSFVFSQNLKGSRFIDTFIVFGPPILNESNQVTFKFEAKDYSKRSKNFNFQVILLPLEKKWQNIYGNSKTYLLPKETKLYVFKVRAVNDKGFYDLTPVTYYFLTKISKFYQDVHISPSGDGLELILFNNTNKEIKITNWRIKTSLINFVIPKGIKDFHPDPLKRKEEEIILPPYGKAVIRGVYLSVFSAPPNLRNIPLSPFGVNFLGNKCFLYLDKSYPANYCDRLNYSYDDILNMVLNGKISRECANLIKYSDCDGQYLSKQARKINDLNCQIIIESWYNYNSCYLRNKDKDDFWGKEWRIYFDPRSETDKIQRKPLPRLFHQRFDQIKLYDENNLLVNQYNLY